jgi:hypothetical protein
MLRIGRPSKQAAQGINEASRLCWCRRAAVAASGNDLSGNPAYRLRARRLKNVAENILALPPGR